MIQGEASVAIDIAAAPERVWELISDVTLLPRFSTELQHAQWAEGFDAPALGAQFLGTNRHPAIGEWTTTSHIVEFEPLHVFGWAVGDPENRAATWQFTVDPIPTGTRLRYTARLGPGRSGVTMLTRREPHRADEIVARRLAQWESGMRATVAGIRELAESGELKST